MPSTFTKDIHVPRWTQASWPGKGKQNKFFGQSQPFCIPHTTHSRGEVWVGIWSRQMQSPQHRDTLCGAPLDACWRAGTVTPSACELPKVKVTCSVMSDSQRPHGQSPTSLLHPWDFPGKSPGVAATFFSRIPMTEAYSWHVFHPVVQVVPPFIFLSILLPTQERRSDGLRTIQSEIQGILTPSLSFNPPRDWGAQAPESMCTRWQAAFCAQGHTHRPGSQCGVAFPWAQVKSIPWVARTGTGLWVPALLAEMQIFCWHEQVLVMLQDLQSQAALGTEIQTEALGYRVNSKHRDVPSTDSHQTRHGWVYLQELVSNNQGFTPACESP